MTDEVVERVAQVLSDASYDTVQDLLRIAFAALQPGDDLGRGMVVVDFIGEYRSENERLRQLLKDARQAAEATREACARILENRKYPPSGFSLNTWLDDIAKTIRALDLTKITEAEE